MKNLLFFVVMLLVSCQNSSKINNNFLASKRVYWNGDIKNSPFLINNDLSNITVRDLAAEDKYQRQNREVITSWVGMITKTEESTIYVESAANNIFKYSSDKVEWYTSDTTGGNFSLYCTFYK